MLGPVLGALYPISQKTLTVAVKGECYHTHFPEGKREEEECQDFIPCPPAVVLSARHTHTLVCLFPVCPVTSCRSEAYPVTVSSQGQGNGSLLANMQVCW